MLPDPLTDDIGATSIEVAALLGDSVVDVKHCIDPKSGKVTRATIAWLAVAGVTLILSAIAFGVAVHVAAHNQHQLEIWTRAMKRPAYSFRAETLGLAYDWMVFGGFALSLVAAGIGLARWRAERRTPFYRVGTAPGVELAVDGAPAAAFPLVAPSPSGDDFVMTYAPGITGELALDGRCSSLADLARQGRPSARTAGAIELPIPANAKIRAAIGKTTFMISAVPAARRHAAPPIALDRRTTAYVVGSLAVHLIVLAVLQQLPGDDSSAQIDFDSQELAGISASITAHEDQPVKREETDGDGDSGGSGQTVALDAGATGKPDVTTHGRLAIENKHVDPAIARAEAIAEARRDGIVGAMSADAFASLVKTGDITSGFDDVSAYGAFDGGAPGDARGEFGWARSGFGRGGGNGMGTIATGGYGTIGTGHNAGDGFGIADGPGRRGGKRVAAIPTVHVGPPDCACDSKDVIRRYIQRNLPKISYCYEKELLAHPTLAGEISVQFFLAENGKVTGSAGSGFDPTVASCVADVVANIDFPRIPAGVLVHYPFTFRSPAR